MSKIYSKPPSLKPSLLCHAPRDNGSSYSHHKKTGPFLTTWHVHELGQLVMAEHGTLHIRVGNSTMLLPPWYCAWIPPHHYHEIWSVAPTVTLRSVYFNSKSCTKKFYHEPSVFSISDLLKEMIRYTERWSGIQEEDSHEQTFLKALQQLLPEAINASVSIKLPSTKNERLLEVIHYLHENMEEKITAEDLSKKFGISPRTLHRKFVQELGVPFSSYLKIARIMHSLELISQGNHSISEVATAVGYDSLPTFSNNFTAIVGNRPSFFMA